MIDLFARSQTLYFESADGKLVFGNKEKLEPGGFIELVIGTDTFRVPVDDKGFYRWEAPSAYADGHYSFSIRHFDNAGNRNPPTLGTVIVDTSAPAAPELLNLYDDQGDKTGSFDAGKATDDKRPTLTGIAQKGSTVYLLNDKNEKIGSAVADKVTGKWVMEPAQDLKDGSNSLRLMAEETFGKQLRAGTPSAPFNIITGNGSAQVEHTGDAAAAPVSEAAPAATEPLARSKTLYFESADGKLVFGNKEKLEPGGFIELVIGTDTFRVPVNDEGFYRWEAPTPYADGEYSFSIRHFDNAGNRNPPTLGTMIVDTTAPDAPELINLYDDQGAVTGSFDAGKATDDKRPTLTGIAQKGSTVYLLNDKNEKIGSAVADKVTGKWVMEPSQDLKDGINSLRLMAEETFGKQLRAGAPSAAFDIVIAGDNVTVTITDALDDAGSFTGALGNGALTDDATPTLRGEVSAADTVIVYYRLAGSPTWAGSATATLSGDTWSWTPGSNLPYGRYEFQASTGDVASALFELEIVSPSDIALRTRFETVIDDFGDATGLLESGAITDDATPTFQGRAEANSQVVIRYTLAGGAAASVTVDADSTGRWSWTPGTGLAAGQWSFDVKSLGQTHWNDSFDLIIVSESDGGFAPVIDYAVDDFGPVTGNLGSGSSTDDSTPALHGRAEANSLVILRYTLGDGRYASASIKADAGGNWSWTPPELASGSWTFEVKKSGQMDWSSFTLTIDPNADRNASIDSALDNAGPVTGSLSSGASTDDTTPTLRGTGPASSVITLRYKLGNGSYTLDSVSVDADGNWSWTPNTLAKGSWTFEVQKAGQSGWSSFKLTIDPALDLKPTIDSAWDDFGAVTGSLTSGDTTDDNTPTLRGTGVAGTIIHFQNGLAGGKWYDVGSTVVKADGTWEWTSPVLSKNGTWEFHAKAQNGDVISGWTGKFILKYVAAAGPVITDALDNVGPVTGSLSSGASTDDSTPTLRGTGPANSVITLRYKLGSGSYASTTVSVDNAGNWSWTPSGLAKGSWTFEVQNAGQSGWNSFQLTIDPDLDRYPTIDSALDNAGPVTGSLSSGSSTDDSTPTLRGTGPANSVITLRYKMDGGSYASTTVSVDGNGKWTWTPSALANGSWTFEVQKAGQSGWSSFQLTIDPTVDRDAVINSAWDDFGAVTGTIANGGTTDDSTPTLRGTGPANSSISLKYSNGDRSGGIIIKVDASGNWTWTAPDLEDGHWTFEVKKDGQENWSRYELTIDSNADRNASIDSAFDNAGPVTGSLSSGASTDDTTPTLRGTGPSSGTITLRYKMDGGSYASTTVSVDNAGNWSWTPSGLAKGSWTFEVQKSGQNGWSSFQLTIDPDLDRYPTIDSALDNVGPVTGSLSSGATTDDTTPTLRGTGPANSVITLRYKLGNGGYTIDSASVDASGNWSWTPNTLAKGSWTFEVQKDGQSGWSSFKLTIDPNLDRNATIDSAFDNVGPVTGSLSSGSSTDDTTPTLRGSGPASGTITLRYKMDGGSYASTTVSVDVNGTWSWTPNTLAKGSWTFEVQKSGQSGWSSFQLTIDPTVDRDAVINSAWDDFGAVTGTIANGGITDDSTPTLRGTGPANSTITLRYKLGSGSYASTTVSVDNAGNWSWTPSALAKGSWTFEVQKAGQNGWSSFQLTIDPTLDRNATIDSAYDDFGAVKGVISNGGVTDDATPTLRGTGPANSVITLRYKLGSGGYNTDSVSVDASGNWMWTPNALASGSWTFEVQKAGQNGWSSYKLTIDPTVDRKPTIDSAWDDFGANTGLIANGGITDDATPTLRGTGPANSTILLRYFHLATLFEGTIKVDSSGNWTWTAPALTDGDWTFEVKKSGQSQWSSYELTIDSTADRNATIDSAWDDFGPNTGSLSSGSSTDDSTPTLRGSGPANSTITLRYKLGSGSYASTTVFVDGGGKWSWTPSGLAKGSWTFEVQKAGQNGWSSFQLTIDPDLDRYPTIDSALDNVGPVTGSLSSGSSTDDSTPTLRGSGPANSVITLRYKLGSGSYASTTVSVDGNGKWTWTPSALANGSWTFEVQKAGQSGWSSFQLTIDPTVDRDAVITSAWDDFGAVTGTIANGGTTDDSTPTLRGTGPANSSITLKYSNGDRSGGIIIKVDASGNWTWTAPDLEDGHWTFEVKKDGQENWSRYELTIDSNADRNASIDSAFDNAGPVTGSLSSGASTDDTTPTLRGSGPANSTITLRYKMDGGSYASTTVSVDNAGNWSWTPSGLAKGSWTFEVQKSGQNGWSSFKLTIDPALDMQPTIDDAWDNFGAVTGSLKNGDTTDDSTPTLRGKGVAGTIIHIQSSPPGVPWETVGSTVVRADGTWEWTSPALSGSNTWDFRAQAQTGDHFSEWSNKFVVKYVAAAPDKPTITDAFDDVGPVTGSVKHNGYTDDSTPTLRGKGVAGSIIHFQNGPWNKPWVNVGSTVVKADGTWEWTSPALDHSDNWHFRAYVENSNGQSDWSDSFILNYTDPTPIIVDAFDDFGAQTGSLQNGDTTDDSTPTLRGRGVAGTIIHIQSSPPGVPWETVGSTVVKADGTWEWTSPALKNSNTWDFQAQAQNGDHYSAWSNKFVVKYVAAAPEKPVIVDAFDDVGPVTGSVKSEGYTDDSTPTLRGRGVAGSIIHFQNGPWNQPWVNVGSTVVKADGSWEWTSPALDHSDNWHFRAYVENSNGQSDWSDSFILNYTDPTPTIVDAFDDFGAQTGSLASGDTTDDQTPTLRGTAPANSVVMIRAQHASGEKTYSVKAGADGKWSWTPDTALAKGDWDFQVKQSGAGNWGESFELNITKDYSGIWGVLDFENLAGTTVSHGADLQFSANSKLTFSDNNTHNIIAKVVKTPDNAPDNWANQCLNFLKIGGFFVTQQESNWGKSTTFSELGCTIWNSGSLDVIFRFVYYIPNEPQGRTMKFTVKAGEIFSFDSADFIGVGITHYKSFGLHIDNNASGIYIDNIYTVEEDIRTPSMNYDQPENIVHFLDGVDELTDHAITGSETQIDTLQLTGKDQLLDLSQHQAEIQSVEIFDIRGSGDNTLKIDLDALLHYGEKDLFIEDGKTQLMVNGDAGDVVQLKDILPEGSNISEWQHQQGTVTVAGVEYEVYSHGDDAELLVQQGVKTELI